MKPTGVKRKYRQKIKKGFRDLKKITVHKRRGRPPLHPVGWSQADDREPDQKSATQLESEECAICGDSDDVQELPSRGVWVCRDAKKGCAIKALKEYPKVEKEPDEDQEN